MSSIIKMWFLPLSDTKKVIWSGVSTCDFFHFCKATWATSGVQSSWHQGETNNLLSSDHSLHNFHWFLIKDCMMSVSRESTIFTRITMEKTLRKRWGIGEANYYIMPLETTQTKPGQGPVFGPGNSKTYKNLIVSGPLKSRSQKVKLSGQMCLLYVRACWVNSQIIYRGRSGQLSRPSCYHSNRR